MAVTVADQELCAKRLPAYDNSWDRKSTKPGWTSGKRLQRLNDVPHQRKPRTLSRREEKRRALEETVRKLYHHHSEIYLTYRTFLRLSPLFRDPSFSERA